MDGMGTKRTERKTGLRLFQNLRAQQKDPKLSFPYTEIKQIF